MHHLHLRTTMLAAKARLAAAAVFRSGRWAFVGMALALCTAAGHAAVLYTFSNSGPSPYSFSLLELNPIKTPGAFAIAPFQVGGLTFTQAMYAPVGGIDCFVFGSAGASLHASTGSCGGGASSPEAAWLSAFDNVSGPGTYTASFAAQSGTVLAAPNHLTIQNVAAVRYTFSNTGPDPYSFSFLELAPITTPGAFAIAPFQVGGLTFTQAMYAPVGGIDCFVFGSAGATLNASTGSCGGGATAPDGAWLTAYDDLSGPGSYTATFAAQSGSAPLAPNHLTIEALPLPVETPEPSGWLLIVGGLAALAATRRRSISVAFAR